MLLLLFFLFFFYKYKVYMVAQQPDVTGFFNQYVLLFCFTIICLTKRQNFKYLSNVLHDGIKENYLQENPNKQTQSIGLTTGPFNILKM